MVEQSNVISVERWESSWRAWVRGRSNVQLSIVL